MTTRFATPDRPDDRNARADSRAASDRMFRAAARHSAYVRIMRFSIPAGLVVALALGAAWYVLNPMRVLAKLPIDPGKLAISGTKVTMQSPRLAGFTRDSRSYELTAQAASQDVTKPDVIELTNIRAKLEMQDKTFVEMTANNGIFDRKTDRVTLTDSIQLTSTTGYEARLTQAFIDVKTGGVVSSQPVEVQLFNGTLNANRLEVVNTGEVVRFDGGVAMTLMPNSGATASAAPPLRRAGP
jgi:lipopolysaccharide export system protein LptC